MRAQRSTTVRQLTIRTPAHKQVSIPLRFKTHSEAFSKGRSMKALVYHGPRKVSVDTVPDAKIEKQTDAVIKLTTTNICGSDLHMYEGRTDVEKGKILGHENLGEVVAVGSAVDTVKKGNKVVLPFNIGCGFCANCERGLTGFCLTCASPSV